MRSEVRRLRRITLSTPARGTDEDEEPSDETSTYPRGVTAIAGDPRPGSAPDVPPFEAKRALPDLSGDDDGDATSVVKRDNLRASLQLAEPPTLAPRGASPPKAAPVPPAKPTSGPVDDGATTSVIVVPPPAFAARPSSPGAPPGPPAPDVAAFSFEPSPRIEAAGLAETEVAPLEAAGFTGRTLPLQAIASSISNDPTGPLPTGPIPTLGSREHGLFRGGAPASRSPADPEKTGPRESFPGGVPLVPPPSSAAQTAPLPNAPDPTRPLLPTLDLHAATIAGAPPGPPPETISVSAQAISQATLPARRRGAKIGRSELYAIGGALVAILIVSYVVLKAVLGSSSAPDGSGASAPVLASAASEPTAQAALASPEPTAAEAPSTATEAPSTASSSDTTAPDPSSAPSAAPKPAAPKPQVYRPPTDPLSHWPKSKKKTTQPTGR